MQAVKSMLLIGVSLLLQAYFLFGRFIFYSLYKMAMIIVAVLVIIPIVYFSTRKKHKYVIHETGISLKKRKVEFDNIKMLRIRKHGKHFGIGIVSRVRMNSLIFQCENVDEKDKLKDLILTKTTAIKVKESRFDLSWVTEINTIIALGLFLFSFTWETKLEPIDFQHNGYSQTNYTTQNYDFLIEDVQFDDMLNAKNHYLLTSKGKITFRQYQKAEMNVLEYYAYSLNPVNMEKERPQFPVMDYYKSNYEGFMIRLIKKNDLSALSPKLFISDSLEAILLTDDRSKRLYIRNKNSQQVLFLEFKSGYTDNDILKVLEPVRYRAD